MIYVPDRKDEGAHQAETRLRTVEKILETACRDALVERRPEEARDLELQRRGVSQALEAVAELRRNYRGRE